MLAGSKISKKGSLNVADMKLAFDDKGKVMKLTRFDIERMPDNIKPVDSI